VSARSVRRARRAHRRALLRLVRQRGRAAQRSRRLERETRHILARLSAMMRTPEVRRWVEGYEAAGIPWHLLLAPQDPWRPRVLLFELLTEPLGQVGRAGLG
jgi:hypothetical protein